MRNELIASKSSLLGTAIFPQAKSEGMNRQTDWHAQQDYTSDLELGWAEVLTGLGNCLNMDRPEHHSLACLKERGVEKGSGQHSTL